MVERLTTLKKRTGFTIVELLVVIVIIGILAAVTMVSYAGIVKRATAATLQTDLANASQQLKIYQAENDAYPTAIDCSATPAANTICLKASGGGTLTYSANNISRPTFKLYETSTSGIVYKITEDTAPTLSGAPGSLNPLTTPTIAAGTNPYSIAISNDGTSVYVTNSGSDTVSMYARNTSTGVLTALATPTIATGVKPYNIVISPDDTSVYVSNFNAYTISMYSRNTITGALTAMTTPTISTGNGPCNIVFSPDGKSVYVSNYNSSTVSMYSRNSSGILTALTPATINIGSYVYQRDIVISPDGSLFYVMTGNPGSVLMYVRDVNTGILTASVSPLAGYPSLYRAVISPDGASLYATMGGTIIRKFDRNISTGILTNLSTTFTSGLYSSITSNGGIKVSSDNISVYAVSSLNSIIMYSRNKNTGILTALPVPSIATGTSPSDIAISADGNSIYVSNYGSGDVSMYSRD